MLVEVLLPGTLPNVVTGIRTGMGYAWRGLIAAEMIATSAGLGYMLFLARDFYRLEVIVLGMMVIGSLWLLIDRRILAPLVTHWMGLTPLTYKEFTPVALLNIDPAGVQVAANFEWRTGHPHDRDLAPARLSRAAAPASSGVSRA
ncbi:MAG: ABC transporter permease [Candidatus Rokuibacteriota bacterium]